MSAAQNNRVVFGLVGAGWRARFFTRIAAACPDRFCLAGWVVRNPETRAALNAQTSVPLFETIDAMLSELSVDFVVSAVGPTSIYEVLDELTDRGMPVLCETGLVQSSNEKGIDLLADLYRRIGKRDVKVAMAEQYSYQPHHAARLAVARSGLIGEVTEARVSACHGYHGVSLVRALLGVAGVDCRVSSWGFESPIVKGPTRKGQPQSEVIGTSKLSVARYECGSKLGIVDFTGDQYQSWIRGQRVLVRGVRGEIIDDTVRWLQDYRTALTNRFVRHQAGHDGNLEGHFLKGVQIGERWVYTNPLQYPLSDEEVAIGTCLLRMGDFVHGGTSFYSLAEGCMDAYLSVLAQIAESEKTTVVVESQPWFGDLTGYAP